MKRQEPNNNAFEFDEQGAQEVSEQIMNAYNSGFIDQDSAKEGNVQLENIEG